MALRGPSRVPSPQRDCVVPPNSVLKCALAPGTWVEVEQRREQFCQEGGETGGKTGVAPGDSRLPSPVQHRVPRKTVKQSRV